MSLKGFFLGKSTTDSVCHAVTFGTLRAQTIASTIYPTAPMVSNPEPAQRKNVKPLADNAYAATIQRTANTTQKKVKLFSIGLII